MRRVLAALLCAGILPSVRAQSEAAEPEAISSSALLLRVRSSNGTLETAREVATALGERATTVRLQFFDLLARRYRGALRDFDGSRQKMHSRMERAVPKVQRGLQKKGGAAEIDELREQCLTISRRGDLTKQHIEGEIDPLMARLRELTLPTVAQILEADDTLHQQVDELREEQRTLQGWFDLYRDTGRALEDEPAAERQFAKHKPEPPPPPDTAIDSDLELLSLMALPMSSRDSKTLQKNDALRETSVPEEFTGTLELNRIRIALGLGTVLIDEKLGNAARDHSNDMRTLGFFSHTSPVEGKRTPSDRSARAGTSGGAENIASGQQNGLGAIRAWWYSPGHHKNMLGNHARTGLGQSETLWTQMFGS